MENKVETGSREVEEDRQPQISGEEALKIQKLICEIYDLLL